MFCPNCGTPVADTANFCSKCGVRISREIQPPQQEQPFQNYTMYEVFDSTNAVSSKINGFLDRILSTPDSSTTLNRFTLTDRSIITDFGEIPYERMTVLAPSGITQKPFGEGVSAGAVYTTIDGRQYQLYYTTQDALRFYLTAIYANERITKTSKRQLMQCMCMYYAYLLNAKVLVKKLPVRFDGELTAEESQANFESFFSRVQTAGNENHWNAMFQETTSPPMNEKPFDEFFVCSNKVTVMDNAVLSPENQQLVDTYTKIQAQFNQFLKENNPIPNSGQNRYPYTLGPLIELMEESDPDASAAIAKYNEKVRQEKEMEERAAARRAAERREAEERKEAMYREGKQDYYWSSECIQRKNFRRGQNRIFRKCEGCRMAPFCTRYH